MSEVRRWNRLKVSIIRTMMTSYGADDELNASPYWRVHSDVQQTWSVLSSYRGRDLYSLPFSRNISWAIVCFSSLPSALFIYQLGGSKSPLLNQLIKQPTPVHWWKKNALVIFLMSSWEDGTNKNVLSILYNMCNYIIIICLQLPATLNMTSIITNVCIISHLCSVHLFIFNSIYT